MKTLLGGRPTWADTICAGVISAGAGVGLVVYQYVYPGGSPAFSIIAGTIGIIFAGVFGYEVCGHLHSTNKKEKQ